MTTCSFLYFEYKSITNLCLGHVTGLPPKPSQFTILVRGIPWSSEDSYCEAVKKFFTYYHPTTYLSHQIVYKCGAVEKIKDDAEYICKMLGDGVEHSCKPSIVQCYFCGGTNSFKIIANETDSIHSRTGLTDVHIVARKKECAAAFVFFKTRYAALMAARNLQASNPMLWVTDQAPEPRDIYWSNLCMPYKQLWIRKIFTWVASFTFVLLFLIPVTFAQGLTQLDKLEKMFPFWIDILQKKFTVQLVTGYLPSVILVLFLIGVGPVMMLLSAVEGPISRTPAENSEVIESDTTQLQDTLSQLNVYENQNVIIAQHIRVPETDRRRLTFGTVGVATELDSLMLQPQFQLIGATEKSNGESTTSLTAPASESSTDNVSGSKQVNLSDDHVRSSESESPASGVASE
ncbi:hypothetical protein KIW84_012556 [Lathyrus oleraceus]|uniref:Uncharacterized protein n=1 Tax=Pisum sativum TaxID=3888 RepID=A0A9D5BHT1_PEA|nr:hypothetical protein KIW84_012556 [Pisum sativum]